jgi:hypothetical protein
MVEQAVLREAEKKETYLFPVATGTDTSNLAIDSKVKKMPLPNRLTLNVRSFPKNL